MISTLVLAAGEGMRLGQPKALAPLAGQPLIERVVRVIAASTVDDIVVVCGAEADRVEALVLALDGAIPGNRVRVVRHAGWKAGRTSSIQAAWRSCPADAHAMIFPVDHPLVRVTTLDVMVGVHGFAAGEIEVIVPVVEIGGIPVRRRRGHPVLLSAALRDEVLSLGPDAPLHDVVHRHVVLEVPVDDEGILLDIDAPEDLARAERAIAGTS